MILRIGIIQCSLSDNAEQNHHKIMHYLEESRRMHAQVVLPPELFLGHYFCKTQGEENFSRAHELAEHPWLPKIQSVAKKLQLVVPCSFFEKSGPHYYNSLAMIDADGSNLGVYRKSHLPDGPGYMEKFYFRPGNTGFKVFATKYGKVGVGICWDQWFPETARILTLMGAQMLVYPTAIGSEPAAPELCTKNAWKRVMKGHAVANMIPLAAANRVGQEDGQSFYGNSFICDEFGEELLAFEEEEGIKVAKVDLERASHYRANFGFFRDRRVDLYKELLK